MPAVPARAPAVHSRLALAPCGALRPLVVVWWPTQRSSADALVWLSPELSTVTVRAWSVVHDTAPAADELPSWGRTLPLAQCQLREPVIGDLIACLTVPPRSATFTQAAAIALVENLRSAAAR